ncbi:MATH and LRR domain-containing protein PFE0570w-like isoform X2 [Myzus persicae]|uniref:MATH and LRR domain-containing protein PFE0570w-like isoform X2 n=1 Tax=Myzus persicae TaxID=13164 RepID=UPI000B939DC6|nr:MATH and LRR domain-containing protein PFE0570w-like isoform X2 [Myzus persicae]
MQFSVFDDQPETIKKFEEDMKYVNSKLKMIDSKLSSIHPINNAYDGKLKDTSNISYLKDQEDEKKIEDFPNSTAKTSYSDTNQNKNIPDAISEVTTVPDPHDAFSKLKVYTGYQFDTNNVVSMNNEMIKNDFVNASTLINKAKKKAKETDLYLKKLHEKILPRCQSADITSDIVKRDIYADIPSKITRRFQPDLKEKLGKNIYTNHENSKIISKPKSATQEKRVHFNNSSGDLGGTNNPHQLNDSSTSIELLSKDNCRNVSITNVNFEDNIPDGKYTNDCKVNKLTVQRIPCVNLKPDLVTQKLVNIQIKPDNKKLLRNYKPNVAYQEFAFELERETCKCHSVVQPKISNDKIVARHEIRKIICGMLDNTASNYPLSDQLISQLQKIITKLEDTKSFDYNESSEVEDLIEEHSMVGFSEEVIKKRLLEIAENLVENASDGISFDQMSVDIENNSRQVLKRLSKIKNSIMALNPMVEIPNLPVNNKLDDAAKYVDESHTNHHPSNILSPKNHHEISSNRCVSVKDFLRHGCNFTSLKMFKNASVIKECGSQITLCSNNDINQNQNIFNTQSALNNQNNISQLKKHQLKFQDQSTLFEDSVSSQPRSSHSNAILKHQLKASDDENQNNDKNYDYATTANGYDCEAENSLKINSGINNTVCKTNNKDMIFRKNDQLTKFEKDKNTEMLEINKNIEHFPINDISEDYGDLKSNIQDWKLSSLSSLTSNNYQHTDKAQIIDERTHSSASTTSSMISLKQSTQEVESEAESLTSLGEVNYFSK